MAEAGHRAGLAFTEIGIPTHATSTLRMVPSTQDPMHASMRVEPWDPNGARAFTQRVLPVVATGGIAKAPCIAVTGPLDHSDAKIRIKIYSEPVEPLNCDLLNHPY